MMRKCHLNTCPVGIATQDPELRSKFTGRADDLINYFFFVAEEVRELMARLGFRGMNEMIGRSDVLRAATERGAARARSLDLSALLHLAEPDSRVGRDTPRHHTSSQRRPADNDLDRTLIDLAGPALERGERISATLPIRTADRAAGAMLSGEIARRFGHVGLPDESIHFRFVGSAGQSFGAFATHGLSLEVEGEANDYVGKGLSGGRLVVRAPRGALFLPDECAIVGNTVLYGATSGEAYFGGVAGERFAVRNSGARAVVEGVGNHGCEYMTGGVVVVLGRTGRNFAAGMSGGVAFVLDEGRSFAQRCNRELVELGPITDSSDRDVLRTLIERHARFTGSPRARHVLAHWDQMLRQFVVVMPREYRQALERTRRAEARLAEEGARHG
jgi:glutamate synthase domain-containing protein 3